MTKLILSCLIVAACGNVNVVYAEADKNPPVSKKVIFDTDMAIDDWSALLLLGKYPGLELLAVTANGAGETRCEPAMKNIPALLDLTPQTETVIACGDDYPIDGFFAFPEPWRIQADTLSGVTLPTSSREVSKKHAVEVLHDVLAASTDKVTLITTGSLTNIAQLLLRYPDDANKFDRVVIMGGSIHAKGNIIVPNFTDGHPNQKAEWNIYVDPLAAKIVFESGLPIELVGLDATNLVKVTTEFAKDFKTKTKTPAADFWDKVLDDNDWFIDSGEYYFWDVLAALVVIDPTFCEGKRESVYVQLDATSEPSKWTSSSIPNTKVSGEDRQHFDPATAGVTKLGGNNPPVKVCLETNPTKAFEVFTSTLNL